MIISTGIKCCWRERQLCIDKSWYHFFLSFFLSFWDLVSLYSSGCPGSHFVDQAGRKVRNPPVSASQVLGLKACDTTPGYGFISLTNSVNFTRNYHKLSGSNNKYIYCSIISKWRHDQNYCFVNICGYLFSFWSSTQKQKWKLSLWMRSIPSLNYGTNTVINF